MNLAPAIRLAVYCALRTCRNRRHACSRSRWARRWIRVRTAAGFCPTQRRCASPRRATTRARCCRAQRAPGCVRPETHWRPAPVRSRTRARPTARARREARPRRQRPIRSAAISIRFARADIARAGTASAAGFHANGTCSTSALIRSGGRIASCIAEAAPADPPSTAGGRMPSASSRQACASACAAGDGSARIGVRRQPKRDIAFTRMPCRASAPTNAMPWSCSPPLP